MFYILYLVLIAVNVAIIFFNEPVFAVWQLNLAAIGFLVGLGAAKLMDDLA